MVVMITPVAFATIQYKTYIIFAVINAFIVPVTYFFYVSRSIHTQSYQPADTDVPTTARDRLPLP